MVRNERTLRASGYLLAGVLSLSAGSVLASTDVTLSALADQDGGTIFDAMLVYAPNEHWTLGAQAGYTTSSAEFSDFSGTTYGVNADLHNDRFGVRLGWRSWDDSSNFTINTTGGRLYWRHEQLEVALLLEQKDFTVQYTFVPNLPPGNTRAITRNADFDADGVGLALSWYGDTWGGYLQYQDFSYGAALNSGLLNIANSGSALRPQLIALAQSVVTRSSAISDSEFGVGVDRAFQRSGLRLDAYLLKDQISTGESTGISLAYRYSITPKVELEATIGGTQSDGFDNQIYGGLAVTFRN
jgi:hypothetical protein